MRHKSLELAACFQGVSRGLRRSWMLFRRSTCTIQPARMAKRRTTASPIWTSRRLRGMTQSSSALIFTRPVVLINSTRVMGTSKTEICHFRSLIYIYLSRIRTFNLLLPTLTINTHTKTHNSYTANDYGIPQVEEFWVNNFDFDKVTYASVGLDCSLSSDTAEKQSVSVASSTSGYVPYMIGYY